MSVVSSVRERTGTKASKAPSGPPTGFPQAMKRGPLPPRRPPPPTAAAANAVPAAPLDETARTVGAMTPAQVAAALEEVKSTFSASSVAYASTRIENMFMDLGSAAGVESPF